MSASPVDPHAKLWGQIEQAWLSKSLYAAIEHNIANVLSKAPEDGLTAAEIACQVSADEEGVYRLLRFLVSHDFFDIEKKDEDMDVQTTKFKLNGVSKFLVDDVEGSMRAFLFQELGLHMGIWQYGITKAVQSGQGQAKGFLGTDHWTFLKQNPEHNAAFNRAMQQHSRAQIQAVKKLYGVRFKQFSQLCDIGGSLGHVVTSVLEDNETLKAIVFDLPHVIEDAKQSDVISKSPAADRIQLVAGDFFDAKTIPSSDLYFMKHIVHDWADTEATSILKNIHTAAPQGATLLIAEMIVPATAEQDRSKALDMHMFVMYAAKERTRKQFEQLLASAGWKLVNVYANPMASVLEAVRI